MRLRRPSHATIVAYLALFIALSGTAMAVKKIGPSGLKKNAVTTKKIADEAVNSSKLKDGAVTESKLKDGAVTGGKLAANSVGTNKLKDDAVESEKLANGAVVEAKIGNDAVTGSKVADGALALADYARAVVDASPDPPLLAAGDCVGVDVPVAGVETGDLVAVYNVTPAPTQVLASGASAPGTSAGTVSVLFCNSGTATDAPATPVKIALLR